ncbi:MAG: hypothetical protein Q9159_007723, partial [Coniocarpon cinnabarinum]
DWEYEFIHGEHICGPTNGIDHVYPGPYRGYYITPTTQHVEEAHMLLDEVIEENGPFDAVMGYSQQIRKHTSPFQLMIFIHGSLPFSITCEHGVNVSELSESPAAAARRVDFLSFVDDGTKGLDLPRRTPDTSPYWRFHPDADPERIQIPTAHIYGRADPLQLQNLGLIRLCRSDATFVKATDAGHVMPRDRT